MTAADVNDNDRRSRWLPATVIALFALVLLSDTAVIALYGSYHNLIEDDGLEVTFIPDASMSRPAGDGGLVVAPGTSAVSPDGRALVRATDDGFAVLAPGVLKIRFRSPNAGADVSLAYDFGQGDGLARCDLTLARVPSRYGVDVITKRTLTSRKKRSGAYHHYLADHVGWFELSLRPDQTAVERGFRVGRPVIIQP